MKFRLSLVVFFVITSLNATTLQEAIVNGLKTDPEILAEIFKYESKKSSIALAQSGYYPTLDLDAGVGYEKSDRENPHSQQTNTDYTRQEVSARLRQPLFEGFMTSSDVSRSKADKEAVGYELGSLIENKSLKIIQAYMDVVKTRAIVGLAKSNLKTHNNILQSIERRYKQGVSDKADLIQIKGRVASAKSDLISAQNNELDAVAVYFKMTNTLPKSLEKVSVDAIKIPLTLNETINSAIKVNPTILAAKKNIEVVKSQKDATISGYYPHFYGDLSANYKNDADGIEGEQDAYQAMVRMEWNLFNGFKEYRQKEIAQKDIFSSEHKAQNTKRQLVLECTLSWNAYQLLSTQLVSLQEHVEFSQEAKSLYEEQYNVGRRSLIDLLNAQVEAFNAAKALVGAKNDIIVAKYRILNSIGTLNNTIGIHNEDLYRH
jgi:adhesin transport system outer membrane protein